MSVFMLLFQKKLLAFGAIIMIVAGIGALPLRAHAWLGSDLVASVASFFVGRANGDEGADLKIEPVLSPEPVLYQKNQVSFGGEKSAAIALVISQESAFVAPSNPTGRIEDGIGGADFIYLYTVREGDTLSGIARSFSVSVNTILWANEIKNSRSIKPGDKLVILPVTGLQHEIKKGETIFSIAKKYTDTKADEKDIKEFAEDILAFNGLLQDVSLEIGSEIIIPDGEIQIQIAAPSRAPSYASRLPEIFGYYMRPVIGGRNSRSTKRNPQGLHGNNGVDLAIACGAPIVASAGGTVIVARNSGWNGGYGRYAVIAHANGTQTLYGHNSRVIVSVGQNVAQGQHIASVGSTGNSTGCHVHFEVRGAKNPVW
jgi:murein DD-endopeptidase MepM/ murein hydrolase activator NlpD